MPLTRLNAETYLAALDTFEAAIAERTNAAMTMQPVLASTLV